MSDTVSSPSFTKIDLLEQVRQNGLEYDEDGFLRWPHGDTGHPRNWPMRRKVFDSFIIMFLDFLTTAISTSGSTAVAQARQDWHSGNTFTIFCFTSIYLYGQALGGIFFPPYSETFGRKSLYVGSMFLYAAFTLVVGLVPSIAGVLVGRGLSGILSAIPSVIVAGSVEDMFDASQRVWMIFAWGCSANLGLAFGPIMGTYIVQNEALGWRWLFYIASIASFFIALTTLFLKESRPSLILSRRLAALQASTPDPSLFTIRQTDTLPTFRTFVQTALGRPIKLYFTEPIITLVSSMTAIVFGLIYLLTDALEIIYPMFGFNVRQSSLTFLPIAVGFLLGIFTRLYDHKHLARLIRRGKALTPEDKIHGFYVGAPCLAIGLWIFAFTIPPIFTESLPPTYLTSIPSLVSLVLVGFAINEFDCTLAGYLTDSYTSYSASAFASLAFLRAAVSGSLPLFTNQMYAGLGPNYATAVLAGLATAFCAVAVLFWKCGRRLRMASVFAQESLRLEQRTLQTQNTTLTTLSREKIATEKMVGTGGLGFVPRRDFSSASIDSHTSDQTLFAPDGTPVMAMMTPASEYEISLPRNGELRATRSCVTLGGETCGPVVPHDLL